MTYRNYQYLIVMTILNLLSLTDDDSEGDGVDEIDDAINDSDIDENRSFFGDHSSVVGAANMEDE